MAVEQMTAQVVVEVNKGSVKMAEQELARLKSPTGITFAANLAKLRQELGVVNGKIRQAQKAGDFTAEIQFRTNSESLKKQITIANRELVNFTRTGSTETSALGQLFQDLGNKIGGPGLGASLGKLGTSFANFVGPAIAGIAALKFAMDGFQQSLALGTAINRVGTVTGATRKELAGLKDQVLDLSSSTGLAAQTLAETAFTLGSAGVAMKDIPQLLEQISLFSVAAGVDTNTAFKGVNAVIQGYGMTLEDVTAIQDLFFTANAQGTLTIEGLASEIQTVVPIANAAGVQIKELFAAFSTLVGVTGNESEVATQLKGAIQALVAPSSEAADTMKQLGIEYGVAGIQAKGLGGLIQEINTKAAGNPEVIKKIVPEVRALTAVLALGGDSADQYAANLVGMADAAGATQKALEDFSKTDEFRIQQDLRRYENFKTKIGNFFVYIVAEFSRFVEGMWSMAQGIYYAIAETIASTIAFLIMNFKSLLTLTDNLVYNLTSSFLSIGGAVLKGLSAALKPIEGFFNSVIDGYNSFVKTIGAGALSIDGRVNLGSGSLYQAGAFSQSLGGAMGKRGLMDGTNFQNTFNYANTRAAFAQPGLSDKIDGDAVLNEKRKKSAKELADFETALDQATKDKKAKSGEAAAKKEIAEKKRVEKEKLDAEKTGLEESKKILEDEISAQKDAISETEKGIKKIEDAIKKFKDINDNISDINATTTEKIAARYNDIGEKIDDIKQKLSDVTSQQESYLANYSEATLKSLPSSMELSDGTTVKDLLEIIKLKKELKSLQDEQVLAKSNTTDTAIAGDQVSETQKLLDERTKKLAEQEQLKKDLETELGIKEENAANELKALTQQKKDQQFVLETYQYAVQVAEDEITRITKLNSEARINQYDAEMQKLRDLIAMQQKAGVSGAAGAAGNVTTTTTTIAPVTTVNAKISNNVDLNQVGDVLAKKVTLASKGVN